MLPVNSPLGKDRICLRCSRPALYVRSATTIVCASCGKEYPIVEGVPVLVEDFAAHREYLASAMAGREEWYTREQVLPSGLDPWLHLHRLRDAVITDLCRKHAGPIEEILDLGCGDGRNGRLLRTLGARVVGTDYNLLRLARAHGTSCLYDSLFMSNLLALPLPDRSCRAILFDQVLEHVPEPAKALNSIARVLCDEGVLVVGIPNEGCWYHQLKFRIKPSLLQKTDHVNFFTSRSIAGLLAETGFEIVETRRLGWGLPAGSDHSLLGAITRVDSWLRRRAWYNKAWELIGRTLLPNQHFLLYLMVRKAGSPGLPVRDAAPRPPGSPD
jgi:SAM-dependent methyltransferase